LKNSYRAKAIPMSKSLCAAALLGLALVLPSQSWSQQVSRDTRGPAEGTWLAAARYSDGRQLERAGQWDAAMEAYMEAAAGGHGPAQKRLGDIYGSGHGVQRDYETSLRWYQRAREQGEEIPLPFSYPGVRR
jgi:TPR repeat protein